MRAVVGVTDNRWATYLRDHPHVTEANFWQPRATTTFKALGIGEPFLFKTHHPENRMVGGGLFSGYAALHLSEAWTIFGEGNGVGSLAELQRSILGYRADPSDPDPLIGCVMLRDLFFVEPDASLEAPHDFAKNIVRFKGYDLAAAPHVRTIFETLVQRAGERGRRLDAPYPDLTLSIDGPTFGATREVRQRVGQQAFRGLVLTSYDRRCAITGSHIRPTLQAAHIRPVTQEGMHRVDNGLLLRSDVHTLFDAGYLGVNERYELQVSPRLRSDFGNGKEFYDRAGSVIALPERRVDRPDREAVSWHMDTVFRSA